METTSELYAVRSGQGLTRVVLYDGYSDVADLIESEQFNQEIQSPLPLQVCFKTTEILREGELQAIFLVCRKYGKRRDLTLVISEHVITPQVVGICSYYDVTLKPVQIGFGAAQLFSLPLA